MTNKKEFFIPCGFRCYTKKLLHDHLGFEQATLPFDNGFFSPMSIVHFMSDDVVDIRFETTKPCIKTENYISKDRAGILMQPSTYEEIDLHILNNGYDNRYLDTTRGYYTLLEKYGIVLAHYNWHKTSSKYTPMDVADRISEIQSMFVRRKNRLLEMIEQADVINIAFNPAGAKFIEINNWQYDLDDVESILTNFFTTLTGKPVRFIELTK